MTKKEQKEMRLNILKSEGKAGLKAFNNQQREMGRMRTTQVHSNSEYDAKKGYRRQPKHRKQADY